MSALDDMRREIVRVTAMAQDVFVNVVAEAHRSIQTGAAITGSPGQPVGQYGPGYHEGETGGTLRDSWQVAFESPTRAIIGTNVKYAKPIEDGIGKYGPLTLRSTVGGFHSRKLTIAGMQRIVDAEVAKVRR